MYIPNIVSSNVSFCLFSLHVYLKKYIYIYMLKNLNTEIIACVTNIENKFQVSYVILILMPTLQMYRYVKRHSNKLFIL